MGLPLTGSPVVFVLSQFLLGSIRCVALAVVRYVGVSLANVRYVGSVSPSLSVGFDRLGLVSVGWNERRTGKNEPQRRLWFVFGTHLAGFPLPGSPCGSPSQILRRTKMNRPHSFGKGMGGCGYFLASEVSLRLEIWPTSLIGGEGLVAGLLEAVGGELWWEGEGEWWRNERGTNQSQP